jgi:hypothetical protein
MRSRSAPTSTRWISPASPSWRAASRKAISCAPSPERCTAARQRFHCTRQPAWPRVCWTTLRTVQSIGGAWPDEPTGDLDKKAAGEILELLEKLNSTFSKTIIMVTHDPGAAERAQRMVHLDKGVLSR